MTTQRRQSPPGGRWLIPIILAIIIVVVVVGALFGSRIKSALTSKPTATPTPQKVVVTATPGPQTPTATPGGPTPTPGGAPAALPAGVPPTATPGTVGVSTPLPGTTPLPTVPGLQVGMIARPASRVAQIQSRAASGDPGYTYYLDPTKVLNYNLPAYGFTSGFTVVQPTHANPTPTPYKGTDGRPVVKYYVRYQGKIYTVQVVQPGTAGPNGIWVIATIFPGQQ